MRLFSKESERKMQTDRERDRKIQTDSEREKTRRYLRSSGRARRGEGRARPNTGCIRFGARVPMVVIASNRAIATPGVLRCRYLPPLIPPLPAVDRAVGRPSREATCVSQKSSAKH